MHAALWLTKGSGSSERDVRDNLTGAGAGRQRPRGRRRDCLGMCRAEADTTNAAKQTGTDRHKERPVSNDGKTA